MTDLINRADAIEAVRKCIVESELLADWNKAMESAQELLSALPSANVIEFDFNKYQPRVRNKVNDGTLSAEALQNLTEPNNTCEVDLISRKDAMGAVQDHFNADGFKGYDDGQKMMDRIKALPSADAVSREDYHNLLTATEDIDRALREYQAKDEKPSAEADGANLINRHDAVTVIREECWKCNNMINDDLFMRIMSLPTSRQTDCTEFIEWLVEVVMDDEDWELNAVAYGEIICRKLEKLGVLEVTEEPSYYIRPSAEAVQGEWGHMMIDGNKLMLALSEWWYSSFGLEETEESKAIHKVMDEVERYVDHEKSADYWIPCSERLPKEKARVLTYDTMGDVVFGQYDKGKWYWEAEACADYWAKNDGVIAWMPLPTPYKGGAE